MKRVGKMAGHLNDTIRCNRDAWPISSTEGIPRAVDLLDRLRALEDDAVDTGTRNDDAREWWSLLSVTLAVTAGYAMDTLSGLPTFDG